MKKDPKEAEIIDAMWKKRFSLGCPLGGDRLMAADMKVG